MSIPVKPYGVTIDEAPAFWQVDLLWVLLASGDQTAGRYCLLWQLCPQGAGPGPHTHEQDEQFYVLDGALTFRAGNQTLQAAAGAFLFIPRGTVHSFRVEGPGLTSDTILAKPVQPQETENLQVTLQPGEYKVYCPVGSHEVKGMKLTLKVTAKQGG